MKKKIILIIIVIVIVLAAVVCWFFIREKKPEFILEKAIRGTVLKEVSETGTVKISEEINLGFENSGRLEKIYVKVGDKVESGQNLAKIETSQIYIELTGAQAALEVSEADYNKLLAGSSPEEIKVAESEVLNNQVGLENAKQNLKDVEADAEEDLNQANEDALDTLSDAYLKIYNAFNVVSDIQKSYFNFSDQESIKVKENKDKIKNALDQAKLYITDISKIKNSLSETKEALEIVRDMAETPAYQNTVSSSDKTSLDNQKSYINTANTNVISAEHNISETKITNETNINNAKAEVSTNEAKLQKAQDELALKKAGPTKENIDLYSAKIKQARAEVSLLQNKIQDSFLKSPNGGQIAKINNREGEMVQPTDSVISFLPAGPFQIEADIYEEDIVDVSVLNPVKITLAAFPDEVLRGRVVLIDPAEKLVEGVVYYKITINFESQKEGLKPGMTADIIIEGARKENVLAVSRGALKKIGEETMVRVFEGGKIEERKVGIGLEGDEYVEVISGLAEGEEIILGEKQK